MFLFDDGQHFVLVEGQMNRVRRLKVVHAQDMKEALSACTLCYPRRSDALIGRGGRTGRRIGRIPREQRYVS